MGEDFIGRESEKLMGEDFIGRESKKLIEQNQRS